MSWKQILKDFTPPILARVYKTKFSRYGFWGDFPTWEDARRICSGYDDGKILNKVKEALWKVKTGEAVCERDSVLFTEAQHSFPLLAGVLLAASDNYNKLNVVDFGGSLGSSYFQHKGFLDNLPEVTWSVVEQQNFVECGKKYFEDERLKFYATIKECKKFQSPNAIIFSSVLQYLERPYSFLEEVMEEGFDYIIIDRTPFLEKYPDRITVQKVPPHIYDASYPAWFFNLDKFQKFITESYKILASFDSFESWFLKDTKAQNKGFILKRDDKHKGD